MSEDKLLLKRCPNCYGSGTVFTNRKTLTLRGSKQCPVCLGKCRVPVNVQQRQCKPTKREAE